MQLADRLPALHSSPPTCHAVTWHHTHSWTFPCPQTRRPDETAQQFAERVQRMIAGGCCSPLTAAGARGVRLLGFGAPPSVRPNCSIPYIGWRTRPSRLLLPLCCTAAAVLHGG